MLARTLWLSRKTPLVRSLLTLTPAAVAATALLVPSSALADERPHLAWDRDVYCLTRDDGESVRVQCVEDKAGITCFVAPDKTTFGDIIDRTQGCASVPDGVTYERLVASNAKLVPAIAEAPPGYMRDETGRAFQTSFDLANRFYIGASWSPTFVRSGADGSSSLPLARASMETGIQVSDLSAYRRKRYEYRILEGSVSLSDLEIRGLLFGFDMTHSKRRPSAWITTFVGEPEVHPVAIPFGWGVRLVNVTDRERSQRNALDFEWTEMHMSYSPLLSPNMHDYLRFEVGLSLGQTWLSRTDIGDGLSTGEPYIGGTAAMRGRVGLDSRGMHDITVDATYARPLVVDGPHSGEVFDRLRGSLAYEGVLLAIDDEPLTLRLGAVANTRDDLDHETRSIELTAIAGLRMSFGVPPRDEETLPALEEEE